MAKRVERAFTDVSRSVALHGLQVKPGIANNSLKPF
jgi:hypothetical protein